MTDSQFIQLKQILESYRTETNVRFDKIDNTLVRMSRQTNKQLTAMDKRLERTMTSADKTEILNGLDASAKELSDSRTEHELINNQLKRHEGWIGQMAEKTGVALGYE